MEHGLLGDDGPPNAARRGRRGLEDERLEDSGDRGLEMDGFAAMFSGDGAGEVDFADEPVTASYPASAQARMGRSGPVNRPRLSSPPPMFDSLEEWVHGWLLPLYRRSLDGSAVTFCREWWRHPEAYLRLDALWKSWEFMRRKPGTGIAVWMRDYCDYHMGALMREQGTFKGCTIDAHNHEYSLEPWVVAPMPTATQVARLYDHLGVEHAHPSSPPCRPISGTEPIEMNQTAGDCCRRDGRAAGVHVHTDRLPESATFGAGGRERGRRSVLRHRWTIGSGSSRRSMPVLHRPPPASITSGSDGYAYLAAINSVETALGRTWRWARAGAVGWMQFEPATFAGVRRVDHRSRTQRRMRRIRRMRSTPRPGTCTLAARQRTGIRRSSLTTTRRGYVDEVEGEAVALQRPAGPHEPARPTSPRPGATSNRRNGPTPARVSDVDDGERRLRPCVGEGGHVLTGHGQLRRDPRQRLTGGDHAQRTRPPRQRRPGQCAGDGRLGRPDHQPRIQLRRRALRRGDEPNGPRP